ncbi:MAG TPA: acetyl-CoA carboxylase biotin carboxyl carrier protein [Chthoniobacteraceae bacterium]
MDLKEIKELIALMRKNDLSEFKLEQEGFKITLRRGYDFQPMITAPGLPAAPVAASSAPPANSVAPAVATESLREITSPMVGTFYLAPSPETPPFVTVGQEVTEDSAVCIIEAMKVMNEIKAGLRGTIVEVVAENGKPVQYGDVLLRVR